MYPDLSYLFHDLFGTSPDNALAAFKTFGVFLILSFLASAYFLYLELRRKERDGLIDGSPEKITEGQPATWQDIAGNAVFGFLVGFKVPYIFLHFDEFRPDPAGVVFSGKGTWIWAVFGAIVVGYYRYWDANRKKLPKPVTRTVTVMPHQRIGDITMVAAVSGIVGARLFSIIESEENIRAFLRDPLDQLLSGSGLAIYGGLIIAFVTVYIYVGRKGIRPIHVMDAVAPALIMGYAVGRLGCQFSGDGDWGIVSGPVPGWWVLPDWLWSHTYPHNVLKEGVLIEGCTWDYCTQLEAGVFPTPIYETSLSLIIFGILWALRKRIRVAGVLFFIYVLLNGIERFFIEKIRTNPDLDILGMRATQAEYIAGLLVITGLAGILLLYARHRSASRPGA